MKSSKVSDLLGKINKAIENPEFPGISKLELDLLKQHIRNLYDELDAPAAINHISLQVTETVTKEVKTDTEFRKPLMRANADMLLSEQPVKQKQVEPVIHVELKQEVPVVKEPEPVIEKAEVIVQKKDAAVISSTINESIRSVGSLNEKLKTTSSAEIHKRLASKPLKELIDLNKRFVLLSELFKGNAEAYCAAISHIDTLPDYESAMSFINSQLVTNYFWDETKQSTRMFAKLIKLKYGVE